MIAFSLLALLLALERFLADGPAPPWGGSRSPLEAPATAPESTTAVVRRAVDGDTLLLESGERIRLIGVDTPETKKPDTPVEPFGPEASAYTAQMVNGKTVQLVFDRERFDQYQRILAYVYVDGLFLNEELIRRGFSAAQTQYPYRADIKRRFLAAEEEARRNGAGLWSLPEPPRVRR